MKWGILLFSNDELDIIKDIAKIHKIDFDTAKFYYTEMVNKIKNEAKD